MARKLRVEHPGAEFGYSKRFALVGFDFNNAQLPRKVKPLGEIYGRVCRENSISG